jgi:hypothetical protein
MISNMLIPKNKRAPFGHLTSVIVLCLLANACGGNVIPIGGDPIGSDDTDVSDTTTADTTTDTNATDGSDDPQPDDTDGGGNDGSGGGNTGGPTTPSGVYCEQYAACDLETPCKVGNCISFPECGSAICIAADEACKLSCPDVDDCAILESYPEQLACPGKVPAIPGTPAAQDECTKADGKCLPEGETAPPSYTVSDFSCEGEDQVCWVPVSVEPSDPIGGVGCEGRNICDVNTTCSDGQTCLDFPEIGLALCISTEEACKLSCPDPATCVIAESYPGRLSCPDRFEATCSGGGSTDSPPADAGAPAGVSCEQHETCDALDPCDEGSCIKVPGCDSPLCIDSELACKQACGETNCRIAESYPEQLFCDDDTTPGEDPDSPVASNDAGGAGVSGWAGPDGGDASVE